MGSPMYGDVLQQVAADVEAGGVFAAILSGHENDSGRLALPLRLLGGLHRLVLDGRAPALRRWYPSTGGRWDAEAGVARYRAGRRRARRLSACRPRSAAADQRGGPVRRTDRWSVDILSHRFDLPIRLFEIGCSAGLNLRADHYRYRYPGGEWGPADSPVTDRRRLAGPTASRRYTCGSSNVTATTSRRWTPPARDGELTLLSYVWPDQQARLDRLRGAISIARRVPAPLHRRNAIDAVAGLDVAVRHADRAVAFDHVAVPLGDRAGSRRGRDRRTGRHEPGPTSPFAHLTLEPHRRTPDVSGRVRGPGPQLARWG